MTMPYAPNRWETFSEIAEAFQEKAKELRSKGMIKEAERYEIMADDYALRAEKSKSESPQQRAAHHLYIADGYRANAGLYRHWATGEEPGSLRSRQNERKAEVYEAHAEAHEFKAETILRNVRD